MSLVSINALDTEWYKCLKCQCSFFVKTEDPDKRLLKRFMRCPNYIQCQGRINRKTWKPDVEIRNFRWTTALELYQASCGLGFSSERDCSPDTIRKLMYSSRVVATEVQEHDDPKKAILVSLTLDNGKVLHLSSSTKGALIYKVTETANGS